MRVVDLLLLLLLLFFFLFIYSTMVTPTLLIKTMTSLYQSQCIFSVYPLIFFLREYTAMKRILMMLSSSSSATSSITREEEKRRERERKKPLYFQVTFQTIICLVVLIRHGSVVLLIHAYVYVCAHACMCVCVCVCVRIWLVCFFLSSFFFVIVFFLVCLFSRAYRQGYIHYVLMNDDRKGGKTWLRHTNSKRIYRYRPFEQRDR